MYVGPKITNCKNDRGGSYSSPLSCLRRSTPLLVSTIILVQEKLPTAVNLITDKLTTSQCIVVKQEESI